MERAEAERLESRAVYRGKVVDLSVDRVRLPNGEVTDMEVIHHQGAAAVLPLLSDGRVLLLNQYRYAIGGWLLELPAGKVERGEEPEAAARRELEEEAGYRVRPGSPLVSLGWIWSTPGFIDERIWLFLAQDVEPSAHDRDPDEVLTLEILPFDEAVARAATGEIHDGKTVCALLRAADRIRR